MRACIRACIRTYIRTCVHVCACARTCVLPCVRLRACACVRLRSCACVRVCVCVHTCKKRAIIRCYLDSRFRRLLEKNEKIEGILTALSSSNEDSEQVIQELEELITPTEKQQLEKLKIDLARYSSSLLLSF